MHGRQQRAARPPAAPRDRRTRACPPAVPRRHPSSLLSAGQHAAEGPVGRDLAWPNCHNARDLGGLTTPEGRRTRWGAVVRSDSLDRLTAAGWRAVEAYGIRTVVDLRNDLEREAEPYRSPLRVVPVAIEDDTDEEFLGEWRPLSTPHYFAAALERWPRRVAAAVAAVARAGRGGVVVHCGAGRDRTGLVAMLLLALAGVEPREIADDYERSGARLPRLDVVRLLATPSRVNARTREHLEEELATERRRRERTTDRQALLATLASIDVAEYLLAAGLDDDDLRAVRSRLV